MAQENPESRDLREQDPNEHRTGEEGGADQDERVASEVEKMVNERVNAALNSHLSRFRTAFEKDLNKNFKSQIQESTGPIMEAIQALSQKPAAKSGESDESIFDARIEQERKKYESRIQELEGRWQQSEKQRQAELAARKRDEERTALRDALASQGITGVQQRAAMSLLYTEDKRIVRDDDGNIRFTVPKAGFTDEVALEDGISDWLKTEEGKAFLPPRSAGGSGGAGSSAPKGARRGPRNKQEREAMAKAALAEAMGILPRE